MVKLSKNIRRTINFKNTKIFGKIVIFIIRTTSNYFWIVVDILSKDSKKIAKLYKKSIGEEYKNECKTLNISKGKKVLHIGCGSYPLTEMTLANLSEANIVGIDKNKKAVSRAKKVILKENLQNKIKIEQGNGVTYPVKDFDLIIVSGCALPKKEILNHLFKDSKKNCNIIIRDFEGTSDETLDCINAHKNIVIKKRIYHPSPSYFMLGWNAFHVENK